jgi:xanthine dehydrogenase YagR molybdenum-binding subunit
MNRKKPACDWPMSRRDFVKRTATVVFTTALAPSLAQATVANRSTASALVQFEPGGRVTVASGSQGLGTGTCTIMAQVAAATLNLRMELIDARLGDSTLPESPVPGGSHAASLTPAVLAAAEQAQLKLLTAVAGDTGSPLHGAQPDELEFKNGRIMRKGQPDSGESFNAFLARNGNTPLGAVVSAEERIRSAPITRDMLLD